VAAAAACEADGSATLPPDETAVIMPPAWPRLAGPCDEDEGYEVDGMKWMDGWKTGLVQAYGLTLVTVAWMLPERR
jgi:hypothetical protein